LAGSGAGAGHGYPVYFQKHGWWGSGYLRVETVDAEGNMVMHEDRPTWTGAIPQLMVTFPAAGEYTIRILQVGEGKQAGQLSKSIFVLPQTPKPLPNPIW